MRCYESILFWSGLASFASFAAANRIAACLALEWNFVKPQALSELISSIQILVIYTEDKEYMSTVIFLSSIHAFAEPFVLNLFLTIEA